ncbi:serine hydrolase domain-containing protein [Planobispora takensis]|uniref:serine hydrolase domain-containing protein n=1 Tax=Planobispora takensis TaxID=1367882 RepID=UPI0035ED235E
MPPQRTLLARMVERVTGRELPDLLQERLFTPMGIAGADWDRVAGGAVFGFHGLHLSTEAVAAFGQLLLREGRWGQRQLIPRHWVRLATRGHIDTRPLADGSGDADYLCGYGYQFWMSRHGYHGDGSFGQLCVVVPSHDLVVATTGAHTQAQAVLEAIWECLLPGLDQTASAHHDEILTERLRRLSLAPGSATAGGGRAPRWAARSSQPAPGRATVSSPSCMSSPPRTGSGWSSTPQRAQRSRGGTSCR